MAEHNLLKTSTDGASAPSDAHVNEPDFRAKPSRRLEIIIAGTALALSGLAYYFSYNIRLVMDPGGINARWWPSALSLAAATLSAVLLFSSLAFKQIDRGEVEESNAEGWARMLQALALTSIYVFAWSKLGYALPTLIYLAALLWIFGLRKPTGLIIFPIATTAFIYGLFHYMLRVPL